MKIGSVCCNYHVLPLIYIYQYIEQPKRTIHRKPWFDFKYCDSFIIILTGCQCDVPLLQTCLS